MPTDLTAPIPAIDTERLCLRGHRREDFGDSAAMWADPLVTRHIGGRPFSKEESWSRLLRYVGHWSVLGFGYWAVSDKATGQFVGEVGFGDFRRDITPSLDGTPEAGWVLTPSAHGKGFATEAMRGALAWFDARPGSARSVCLIDPGNEPSIRVAKKCGFAEAQRTTYKGEPTLLFERTAPLRPY